MSIFQSVAATKVIFVLGITNLLLGSLIFLSCRCIPGWKVTGRLAKHATYKRFFKFHCSLWWIFGLSVVVHVIFAIGFSGIPF